MNNEIDYKNGCQLVYCAHCQGTGTCRNDNGYYGFYSCAECQRNFFEYVVDRRIVSCAKCNGSGHQLITQRIENYY